MVARPTPSNRAIVSRPIESNIRVAIDYPSAKTLHLVLSPNNGNKSIFALLSGRCQIYAILFNGDGGSFTGGEGEAFKSITDLQRFSLQRLT